MPPRASDTMVSREDLGYGPQEPPQPVTATPNGISSKSSASSWDDQSHSSSVRSGLSYNNNGGLKRTPSTKSRRRRRIDFSPNVTTIEVEHMDDLPGELIWYDRDEYDDIKQRNSSIIRTIKAGEFEENEEYSCRGLEHKLKEVFRQRRANKFNALNAVLEEQDRQIHRGIHDPQLICAAYQVVSVRCQESANTIAFRDYKFSLCYDPTIPASGKPQPKEEGAEAENGSKSSSMKKKKKSKDKNKGGGDDATGEDGEMSPKGEKKKGVRRVVHGARKRMMRRMSM